MYVLQFKYVVFILFFAILSCDVVSHCNTKPISLGPHVVCAIQSGSARFVFGSIFAREKQTAVKKPYKPLKTSFNSKRDVTKHIRVQDFGCIYVVHCVSSFSLQSPNFLSRLVVNLKFSLASSGFED